MLNTYESIDNVESQQQNHVKKITNNVNIVNRTPSFQVTPKAVYHIVHNNNNRNDNTLKKRNALVAFEFKKLVSKYNNDTVVSTENSSTNTSNSSNGLNYSNGIYDNINHNDSSTIFNSNVNGYQNKKLLSSSQHVLPYEKKLNNALSTSLTNITHDQSAVPPKHQKTKEVVSSSNHLKYKVDENNCVVAINNKNTSLLSEYHVFVSEIAVRNRNNVFIFYYLCY